MSALVLRADAAHLPLAEASVDLIVTSPPYWAIRSYTDGGDEYDGQIGSEPTPSEYIDALIACTREWQRVLKPTGSMFVNLGDKYANDAKWGGNSNSLQARSDRPRVGYRRRVQTGLPPKSLIGLPWRYALACIDELGLTLRKDNIWHKPNPIPESATDRCASRHEYLFHFSAGPRYYAAIDDVRVPHTGGTHARRKDGRMSPKEAAAVAAGQRRGYFPEHKFNPLGKLPGSVWEMASQPLKLPDWLDVDHFAPFPVELPRRCILGWSPPGGVVLDPFGGTGTTALVAEALGRRGISADLSHDYGRAAMWRVTDPGERARAMQVPKPPPVPDGQDPLFDLAAAP